MILKNKALLLYDFLTSPAEKIYERAARFYFKSLLDVARGKAALAPQHAQVLELFPEVAAALGPAALEHAGLAGLIRANPMAAMRLLLACPAVAPLLEGVVLGSSEATYYFLKALRDQKKTPPGNPELYRAALLRDPFWALRYYGDTQEEDLLAQILVLPRSPEASPEAAYLYLYFNPEADPGDFLELISRNAFYAYLGSRHFYDRGAEFRFMNLRGLTPRWAYHFITDGFLDEEEGLVEIMLASPDWLVEYLVESERYKDLAYTGTVYQKAMEKGQGNLQTIYLKMWWERVEAYVKKNPPPPPKTAAKNS
jgi:hypothetical protein